MTDHLSLERDEFDGVPVFWTYGQAPLTATLVVRMGVRDESFVTAGITHLAARLVTRSIARPRHDFGAVAGLSTTEFSVTGRDDAVLSHLAQVCRALTALTVSPEELPVPPPEPFAVLPPVAAAMLRSRYGWRGVGLADVQPPALAQVGLEEVRDHVARHCTRRNVALALTGPPPPGLRLDLPPGPRVRIPDDVLLDLPLPRWHALGGPALGLSFLVPADDGPLATEAALTVLRIALDRASEVPARRLADLDFVIEATRGASPVCFHTETTVGDADVARAELTSILRDLRGAGPTATELEADLASFGDHLDDPRSAGAAVLAAATSHLLGEPVLSFAERLPVREAVTAADCRAALALLDETLIVGLPPAVVPADATLTAEPDHSASSVQGRVFRRARIGAWRGRVPHGALLVVGEEGVSLRLPEGPTTIRWDDVAGAECDPVTGVWTLVGADGMVLPVAARWFRDGDDALGQVLARIPLERRFRT